MITIFSGDFAEAVNVKNILENAGIQVFALNEYMSGIEPVISPGGFNPMVLQVGEADVEKAAKVVNDYTSGNLAI